MSASSGVTGAFGVANADDLYGRDALEQLRTSLLGADDAAHSLVGFRLVNTVFGAEMVKRGVCRADPAGQLVEIVEQQVTPLPSGGGYFGTSIGAHVGAAGWPLSGDELVSMNLWGFYPRMFDHLGGDRSL